MLKIQDMKMQEHMEVIQEFGQTLFNSGADRPSRRHALIRSSYFTSDVHHQCSVLFENAPLCRDDDTELIPFHMHSSVSFFLLTRFTKRSDRVNWTTYSCRNQPNENAIHCQCSIAHTTPLTSHAPHPNDRRIQQQRVFAASLLMDSETRV